MKIGQFLALMALAFAPIFVSGQTVNFKTIQTLDTSRLAQTNDQIKDADGNIYRTGRFFGTAITEKGKVAGSGSGDFFLAKYGPDRKLIWSTISGCAGREAGQALCLDTNGAVYVSGYIWGTACIGTDTIIARDDSLGDMFVAKFDKSGAPIWTRTAGGPGMDVGKTLETGTRGAVTVLVLSGSSELHFGIYTAAAHSSCPDGDAWFVEYGSDGSVLSVACSLCRKPQ